MRDRRGAPVILALVICALALFLGAEDTSAQRAPRGTISWDVVADPGSCPATTPSPTPTPGGRLPASQEIRFCVAPGATQTASIELMSSQPVSKPRIVRQTSNGMVAIKVTAPTIDDPLPAAQVVPVTLEIKIPAGLRAQRLSGRVYLADRNGVMVPPLNIRIEVLHPRPEDVARTPVVVPLNHVQMIKRPASMPLTHPQAGKFNLRDLSVTSGTTITWTNRDTIARAVKGTLCAQGRIDRTSQCTPDPLVDELCAGLTPGAAPIRSTAGVIACFLSNPLGPEDHYSVLLTRPDARIIRTYFIEDGMLDSEAMADAVTIGGEEVRYYPYLTVK